jgi:hypothetical protein
MAIFLLLVLGGPIIAATVGYFNANKKLLRAGIPGHLISSLFRPFKIARNCLGVALVSLMWLFIFVAILEAILDLFGLFETWISGIFILTWIIGTTIICYLIGMRMTFNGFYTNCTARIQLVEKEYAKYVNAASSLIDEFQQHEAARKRDEIGASLRILQDARAKFEVLM